MHACLRTIVVAVALALLTRPARADDQLWLELEPAGAAARVLTPGTAFVEWVSHNAPDEDGGLPVLHVVERVAIIPYADHFEVEVSARMVAVAEASPASGGAFRFRAVSAGPLARKRLDLAYVYVPSPEVPGMFVNLAKRLGLPCQVRWIAIEVPEPLARAAASRRR